jgi:hypothetical protein
VSESDSPQPPSTKPDASQIWAHLLDDAASWQLVFLIAVTFVASLWNLDVVRRGVFEVVGVDRVLWAEAALEDPNDDIAARACAQILTNRDELMPTQLIRTLYIRPEVAFRCLAQSTEIVEARREEERARRPNRRQDQHQHEREASQHNPFYRHEPELVPRHQLVASTIGRRWMADLIEGASNACETAYSAKRALEHADLDPTYQLMSCAVAADSQEVRQCCVNQLGGHETFAELVDRPDLVPLRQVRYDYRALAGASFPSVPVASASLGRRRGPLTPDAPSEPVEDGEERFEDLQFDVQDWVIEVGCRLHYSNSSRREVPASLVALVESKGCAPSSPPWSGMYSAHSWSKMCLGMYDYRRKLAYTPREALCNSLSRATLDQTISVAELMVTAAISEARQVPGVARESLDIVGENFGDRLFGFRHGEPVEANEEPESNWRGSGRFSPMEGM